MIETKPLHTQLALWILAVACVAFVVAVLTPKTAAAASCSLFDSGIVRTKNMTAQGTSYQVGIKKKGSVIRIVDSASCERVDAIRFTKSTQKRTHRIRVANLWQGDGPDEVPEIVITDRIGSKRMKLRVYTVAADGQMELLLKKTVNVSKGKQSLTVADKQIVLGGTAYQIVTLLGSPVLRPVSASLQFLTIGDSGDVGDDQDAVAAAMSQHAEESNDISFIGMLGDNFYPSNTISSVEDEDWETAFHAPYRLDGLDVPFHVALGNHDYDDNDVTAILAYTDPGGTWNLPSAYHSFTYPAGSATPLIEYIVLDTYTIRNELDGYEEQLAWLESKLESSTARWKIVAGHHLVYSYGVHGGTSRIVEHVLPILKSAGADLYLAGHDHDKQYIDHPDDDIAYMVNGAASRLRDTSQGEYSEFAASTLGFTSYTVTNNKLSIEFYDTNAQVEFQKTLSK